jgi:curved DNA-binding protein CbpA
VPSFLAPDYYATLSIPSTASPQAIRDAYKKAALKHHPDRVPADSPERAQRTRKFQQINDAYFTLSDPARRRDYDAARRFSSYEAPDPDEDELDADEEVPRPGGASAGPSTGGATGAGSFPWSSFFGSGGATGSGEAAADGSAHANANDQFGSVFEEMLREEGMAEGQEARPTQKFWSIVGGLSGGAMGFIVAKFPGAIAGAVAGNRLGAVRDSRGKSVYSVFQELPQSDKAKLLSDLAAKVFAHAIS